MRSNIRRDLRSEIRIVAASLEDGTQPESNIHIFISVDCMHPVFEIRDQDISSVTRIQYLRSEIRIVAASAEVGTQLAVGAITTGGRDRFPEPKNVQPKKQF